MTSERGGRPGYVFDVDAKELDPEIRQCDELVDSYGDVADPYWREQVALALFWKARKVWMRGDREDALPVWSELADRFAEAPEPEIRQLAVDGLIEKGTTLIELRRLREARRTMHAAIRYWTPRQSRRMHGILASALFAVTWVVVVLRLQGPVGRVAERLRARRAALTTA